MMNELVQERFNLIDMLTKFRHYSTLELMSYRSSLQERRLSAISPIQQDGEKQYRVKPMHTEIWDLTRNGYHPVKDTHETAINHHIAVNFILRERGIKK